MYNYRCGVISGHFTTIPDIGRILSNMIPNDFWTNMEKFFHLIMREDNGRDI